MDDDFDLPDEGGNTSGATGASFIDQLFGDSKKSAPRASTFDDILASVPKQRKPTVTFQDPPISSPTPPAAPPATSTPATVSPPSQPSTKMESRSSGGPSSSLLDSLFPTSSLGSSGGGDFGGAEGSLRRRPASASGGPRMAVPSRDRQPSQAQMPPPSAAPAIQTPEPVPARSNPATDALLAEKDREIEQLRRELSSLRYEKSEDQKTILELRRKLEFTLEDHQRILNHLHEEQRAEMKEMSRRHEQELDDARREAGKSTEILNDIRKHESSIDNIESKMDTLNQTLTFLKDSMQTMAGREEDVDKIVKMAEQQASEGVQRLEMEKKNWESKKNDSLLKMEEEMEKMRKTYAEEIVQGRKWLEEERRRLHIERVAFQEEQAAILDLIEQKKEELDSHKNEFLNREHDLLIRVVNEKALFEQQRKDFERQRNADVNRLREEAEHLEKCLTQVENARRAFERARKEYDQKNEQLNDMKNMLMEYEQAYRRDRKTS
ncbi:hypothetical protein DdX_16440 [Ditylenchus destructor]|uniref:Uncharacterized protein n=1 Tax=Ditylenchus destructor TaxID=166010 RepID=A0AAD4MQD2_9BILA|nr:hypothetical protein DdX_16440 [Ditylenchus destructor]